MLDEFLENHRDALDGLKEEKFDIVFAEQLDLCGTALKEALKIKTHLWISSCPLMDHMAWILGVPTPLSYVPVVGDMDISDKPSYIERIWNIIEYIGDVYVYKQGISEITQIYRKHYGENFPDAEQIARDSPITFVLADEFLDFPRPILHNTIYIGGVGIKNNTKGLPEPYKTELEKGKKGVVFFSLGSNANTKNIPYEFKKNLFEAFKNLPEYHFLVKINEGDLEGEELAKSISNLFIFQWAPQPDILAHPKLKAFITHGRVAERNGWGVTFDKKKLLHGSKEFLEALKKILEDPSYQEKAQRTKRLLSTKPFSSSEKFIKFVEFVAENDGILPELQNE
uniref:glucuronosyltransferase n=1 Tax=Acrobeloides nanus TaxID=290746 RepID=A0A914DUU6_9BILA